MNRYLAPIRQGYSMTGVRATIESNDCLRSLGNVIDHSTFALIAPLKPHNHYRSHVSPLVAALFQRLIF